MEFQFFISVRSKRLHSANDRNNGNVIIGSNETNACAHTHTHTCHEQRTPSNCKPSEIKWIEENSVAHRDAHKQQKRWMRAHSTVASYAKKKKQRKKLFRSSLYELWIVFKLYCILFVVIDFHLSSQTIIVALFIRWTDLFTQQTKKREKRRRETNENESKTTKRRNVLPVIHMGQQQFILRYTKLMWTFAAVCVHFTCTLSGSSIDIRTNRVPRTHMALQPANDGTTVATIRSLCTTNSIYYCYYCLRCVCVWYWNLQWPLTVAWATVCGAHICCAKHKI